MSRREDIDNAVWSDPDFHGLSPAAKLVYLWTFTNPRCGMAGIYKVVLGAIALETGLSGTDVSGALEELRQERFVLYTDGVLWVRTRVKHLRTKTPQIAKSIARDLEQITSHPLTQAFLDEYRTLGWLSDPLQRVTRGSHEPHETSDTDRKNGDPPPTVTRGSGDPLGQGQGLGSREDDAPSRTREASVDDLPDDLPERLHESARQVQQRLLRLHDRKPKSIRPALGAIGRVLVSMPDRDHVAVADDVELYWTFGAGQNKSMRDLVATYRNRLSTAPVVAPGRAGAGGASRNAPFDVVLAAAERREREMEKRRAQGSPA
jgi:hypothetical protein